MSRHAATRRPGWQDAIIIALATLLVFAPLPLQQLAGWLAGPPAGAGPACGGRVEFEWMQGWVCPQWTYATSGAGRA